MQNSDICFASSQIYHQIADTRQVFFLSLGLDFNAGGEFDEWFFEWLCGWRTHEKGFGWPAVCYKVSVSWSSLRMQFQHHGQQQKKKKHPKRVWNEFVSARWSYDSMNLYSRGQKWKCHKIPALGCTGGLSSRTLEHQRLQGRCVMLNY